MRVTTRLVTAGICIAMGLGGAPALAQSSRSSTPGHSPVILDVPYLSQSVLLCGGAAVAMVERWWGRRGVYAEDFAALVHPDAGGILTSELTSAVQARGWNANSIHGTAALVQASLRDSVPVVVLIQVSRNQYHYVVVLGWTGGRVTFHDPARVPFATLDESTFLERWTGADRWALVIRPAPVAALASGLVPAVPASTDSMPCPPWLDRALDAVAAGRLDDASRLLAEAGRACPGEPLLLRELAGVRFKQARYPEAIRLAEEYLALAPGDSHAWQLLATSRYLAGDADGALEAWNRVGRPKVDLLRVDGARATRFQEIAGATSVSYGKILTPSSLALARRRVSEVPSLSQAAVEYQPVPGGLVEVRVAVLERPVIEPAWRLAAAGVIRALAQDEVGLAVASPTGAGELWSAIWRWDHARPRLGVRIDLPVRLGVQGVVGMESSWDRFRFALDPGKSTVFEETRRTSAVGFGGWISAGVRPSAGLRLERWSGQRSYLAFTPGTEIRSRDDRLALNAMGEHAFALGPSRSYTRLSVGAAWASSLGLSRPSWSTQVGFDWASGAAPLGSWPVAGANLEWAIPLRAHPLTSGGFQSGRTTGRGIAHATLAGDHPVYRLGPLVFAAGVFLDGAELHAPADGSGKARFYLDGGAGIRIGVADGQLGVLRIDLARSLTADRHTALTVGVHRDWPHLRRSIRGDATP